MKFKILIILSFVLTTFFTSCSSDITVLGNWVFKGYTEGKARADGTSFSINNIGYFGMGKDNDIYFSDFWKYDFSNNSWNMVESFPGTPRAYNISLSNGGKGYIGLGYDGENDLSDFWEYDPANDKWTQLADFPGGPRRWATAFAIGADIYVGTGYNGDDKAYFNDFYVYSNGAWKKTNSFTGDKRCNANSVSFNGKGYVISGRHNNVLQDFWEFDPLTEKWTQLSKLNDEDNGGNAAVGRYNASTFISESKLYIVGGTTTGSSIGSCFEWDPTTLEWTEKAEIENSGSRESAGCFVLDGYGYLVGGRRSSLYLDDCYKFEPSIEKNADD